MTRTRFSFLVLATALTLLPLAAPSSRGDDKDVKFNLIYVPTDEKVIEKMFEMGKVNKNDVVFDLGCGDGRIVAMACKKFGCKGVGVDLNPQRIRECMDTIKKYEVEPFVDKYMLEYRLGNALTVPDLDKATVVMLYMLPEFMDLLKPIAKKALKPGSRVVSHDYRWRGEDWEPEMTVNFQGPSRNHTLYLWTVKDTKDTKDTK
jgi:SAM-dependent methyltransferase